MLRSGESRAGTRARPRLWPVAVVLVAFYTPFLVARLSQHDAYWFVHVGRQMLDAGRTSTEITPALGWQSEVGYDGQYYFALAVDPAHADDYMPGGIAGIVYSRPVYPALAGMLGASSTSAVPWAMLILNLVAVGAGTLAVASWLRRRRVSPWFALLYGLFPGLIFAVFRDLTEPTAFALVTLAAVTLDRRTRGAVVLAAALFSLAGLTRETTLVFAVGAAVALLGADWRARWPRSILFLAGCVAPLLVWRLVVGQLVSGPTQERGDGLRSLIPFNGLAEYWPWDTQHVLIVVSIVLPTLLALAGVPRLLGRWRTRPVGVTLGLNAAAFVVFLPSGVGVDYGAAGRAAVGVVLATVACLPAWCMNGRPTRYAASVAFLWSLPWYALVCAGLGIAGLTLITT
jgi:hypothetical protein